MAYAVHSGAGIMNKIRVKTHVSRHAHGCLYAHIRKKADSYKTLNTGTP
jgi:hypothetical protein